MRVSCVLSSTLVLLAAHSFVASPVQADTKPPAAATPAPAKPPAAKTAPPAPQKAPGATKPTAGETPKAPGATKPTAGEPPKAPGTTQTPPATPPTAEQSPKEKAEALLDAGRKLLDAHESDRAIGVLEEAHGVLNAPESGYELMRAYADVGKLVEAINLGEKLATLSPSSKDPAHVAETQKKIKESLTSLSARVSTIQLQIQRPSKDLIRVKIDENTLLPEQLDKPIRVNAGKHELRVTAPGYEPLIIPKDIDKGTVQQYPVKIDMTPIPVSKDDKFQPPPPDETRDEPLPTMVKVGIGVSGGLGAIALGTGIAAGLSYIKFVDSYNRAGCGATCDADVADRRPTLQALSVTSLVTGVLAVGAATATVVYSRKNQKTPEQASWHVSPTAGGIVIHGRW